MQRIKVEEPKAKPIVRKTTKGEVVFVKGGVKPEGSGRKKGQQNRHTVVLKDCILTAMGMIGRDGKGKDEAEGYLARIALLHPDLFIKLLEKMLPFSLTGGGGGAVQVEYSTREEIVLRMKERGLPIPQTLLAAPKRNPKASVIEGEYEEVNDEQS
jgi:hypothetical protein